MGLVCPELHFASHRRVIGRIETDSSGFELRFKVQVEGSEMLLYAEIWLWFGWYRISLCTSICELLFGALHACFFLCKSVSAPGFTSMQTN